MNFNNLFLLLNFLYILTTFSTFISIIEYNSLQELYDSTYGKNWNWKNESLNGYIWDFSYGFNNSNVCNWQGINCICDNLLNFCYIDKLNLQNYNLNGRLTNLTLNLYNLTYIGFNNNNLIGSIPNYFTKLEKLQIIDLSSNFLTGTVPSFGNMSKLEIININNNKLNGSLDGKFSLISSRLSNIDVSYNQFTGIIPSSIFDLTSLLSFESNENCFNLYFPLSICSSTSLQVLNLDGLSTASNCRSFIFPQTDNNILPKTFILDNSLINIGSIPECLFNMKSLQTLHLSGNGFTGTLSNSIVISSSLIDLTLSWNNLQGDIPLVIQDRIWTNLDLSFNKFTGILSPNIPSISSINLEENSLSGKIPTSLITMKNIKILHGNLFQCNIYDRISSLPLYDNTSKTYICGSSDFNLALLVTSFIMLVTIFSKLYNYKIGNSILEHFNKNTLLLRSFDNTNSAYKSNIVELCNLANNINICLFSILKFLLLFIIPVSLILTSTCGIFSYSYAWSVTTIFLSGIIPTFILTIAMFISISFIYNLFHKYLPYYEFDHEIALNKEFNNENYTYDLILIIFFIIDMIILMIINIYFVETLSKFNVFYSTLFKFSLAIFNILWMKEVIPYVTYFIFDKASKDKNKAAEKDVFYQCVFGILNNIFIPFTAYAFKSPNCFYNAFHQVDSIVSNYLYNTNSSLVTNISCLNSSYCSQEKTTTYEPVFFYNYQCSSNIVSTYSTVYLYMIVILATSVPFNILLRKKLSNYYEYYFQPSRFIVDIIIFLLIGITIGFIIPLLGIAICAGLYFYIHSTLSQIGSKILRLKSENKIKNLEIFISKLEKGTEDMTIKLCKGLNILIIPVMVVIYLVLNVDQLGDEIGFRNSFFLMSTILTVLNFSRIYFKIKKNHERYLSKVMFIRDASGIEIPNILYDIKNNKKNIEVINPIINIEKNDTHKEILGFNTENIDL